MVCARKEPATVSERDEVIYIEVEGVRRRYVAHTPPGFAPDRPRPAVVMLDGRGGTPWTAMKSTGWSAHADAHDFVVLYPEATRLNPDGPLHFLDNPQMWNAGGGSSDAERAGPDDVAFLRAVLADARDRLRLDPRRCFMTGFSNGAVMTFRFAAEEPDLIAAIAPVAGHFRPTRAALRRPVPALLLFGQVDPLSPFAGGPVDLPWGGREVRPAARDSAVAWARLLGLGDEPMTVAARDGVTTETFGPDTSGHEVIFCAISDLGHVWPGGHRLLPEKIAGRESNRVHATALIWEFFSRHPLP
jgi:polyhydroxybutyrate depolymerase